MFEAFTLRGTVVKGFGRGSKELGIPTANFDESILACLPEAIVSGIYFGLAQVEGDDATVYPMCMSIGWNPYYQNEKRSVETHVIHVFGHDFYGKELRVCVLGKLRDEKNFSSLDDLIAAIHHDIDAAKKHAQDPCFVHHYQDPVFARQP